MPANCTLRSPRRPFDLITEVPWDSTTLTSRYNPLQKLPILLLEDGSSIYDSSFILEYLALKHPSPPLVSATPLS